MQPLFATLAFLAAAPAQSLAPARIDGASLLREIPSRAELARLPQPAWTLEHSTKRLRVDERGGRREAVLAEVSGPGAFVRLWLADARGKLRLYLGTKAEPALVIDAQQLFALHGAWPALRNSTLAQARLPLSFAAGARLTLECADEPEFELAWRSYAPGTAVADWSPPQKGLLDELAAAWEQPPQGPLGQLSYTFSLSRETPAGDFLAADPALCAGPRAVSEIVLRVDGPDLHAALHGLVLHLAFDGEETVVCPLAFFFSSLEQDPRLHGPAARDLVARCVMPYRERMDLFVENLGPPDTHVSGAVYTQAWKWDERSLHFGARWIAARGATRLSIEGQGQLVGIVPASVPLEFRALTAELDGRKQPLREALALLERAPFRERLVFELAEHAEPAPQRVAFVYLRPGAKFASRDPQPSDRESLAADR